MQKTLYSAEYETFRAWLVGKRQEKKLTQRAFAALLDAPNSLVAKVEQGERRLDVIEFVYFCKKLEIDPKEGVELVARLMK